MKYVEACLSAREVRESCFHRSGCSVRLLQVRERPDKVVLTSEEALCSSCRPV